MLSALKTKKDSTNTHIKDITSRSKGKGDTNVCLKTRRAVLMLYQGGSVKHHLEVGEEEAHLLFSLGQVFKASGFLEFGFLSPVKREPLQEGMIVVIAADLEELALEAFVRLLEEGQQNSPINLVEVHPQLAT